jgi:hypothetical protein
VVTWGCVVSSSKRYTLHATIVSKIRRDVLNTTYASAKVPSLPLSFLSLPSPFNYWRIDNSLNPAGGKMKEWAEKVGTYLGRYMVDEVLDHF